MSYIIFRLTMYALAERSNHKTGGHCFCRKCNLFTLNRSQVSHIDGGDDAWISGARDICSYHGPV